MSTIELYSQSIMKSSEIYQSAVEELSTVLDLTRWGASHMAAAGCYFGHGTDNAWDEAMSLVLFGLHLDWSVKPEILSARLTRIEREKLVGLFKWRIEEKLPAAYITHRAYFAGLAFYVDQSVLIPRSPVAEIIEQGFDPWFSEPQRILDLCTGSGCIAIACEAYCPSATVDAVDISPEAIKIAEINSREHHSLVNLYQGDLFEPVGEKQYDIIVTNPPYVDQADMDNLPKEYTHEPALGLAAGEDGLDIIHKILSQAKSHLTPEGILILEVGNSLPALYQAYPDLRFMALNFERGGEGVVLIYQKDLPGE